MEKIEEVDSRNKLLDGRTQYDRNESHVLYWFLTSRAHRLIAKLN